MPKIMKTYVQLGNFQAFLSQYVLCTRLKIMKTYVQLGNFQAFLSQCILCMRSKISAESLPMSIYAGIFLISVATLMLEISLTRVFSVSQWYHFAFMVISIALLGIAASGSFLSVFPSLFERNISKLLTIFSTLFSLSCIFSFLIINQIPFDPFQIIWSHEQMLYLAVSYFVLAIPFFLFGLCISTVLTKMAENVSKIYFFNLVGSGIGCLLAVCAFSLLSSNVIVLASLLGALAAFFFSLNFSRKVSCFITALAIILTFLLLGTPMEINMSPYKSLNTALKYPDATILSTNWNSFSRVDVIKSPAVRYAPGLSFEYRKQLPLQLGITIDGNSLSAVTTYDNLSSLDFIEYLPTSLPYELKEEQKVLIIEPGGGLDVLTALYNGARSVTVVEMNPLVVDAIKSDYNGFSGNFFQNKKVILEIDEGRSFVRRTKENYDVIQVSLTGDVITGTAGIYGLSENYLYTTDAFEDYYNHLEDNGTLVITRWLEHPPKETPRLVSLAVAMLSNHESAPENHIAIIRSYVTTTFLLKKSEFSDEDIKKIKEFCKKNKYDLVYIPGINSSEVNLYNRFPEPYFYEMTENILSGENQYEDYLFDISPVGDDRPFFFNFFRWKKIVPLYESMGKKWVPLFEGGFLVVAVFAQALILSTILIFLPLYSFKRIKTRIAGKARILTYFFLLGIGYMFVEIAFIQKFILFLGQPIYSMSTVLFSLLMFSGFGSLFSEKIKIRSLRETMIVLSILIFMYLALLPFLFNLLLGQELLIRILFSVLILAPLGFLMGIPFPMGIRIANKLDSRLIPWAWCSNGCASVLSSVGATMLAISFGFSRVLMLAGIVYLIALAMILILYRTRV